MTDSRQPPIEGAFYFKSPFIFQLHEAVPPYRNTTLRDWNGHWKPYPTSVLGDNWLSKWAGENWRIIDESDPLFDECCKRAAIVALTEGTTP